MTLRHIGTAYRRRRRGLGQKIGKDIEWYGACHEGKGPNSPGGAQKSLAEVGTIYITGQKAGWWRGRV